MNSEITVAANSLQKLSASQIDAAPEARRFLETLRQDGVYRLRFWQGTFWFWDEGAYRECGEQEVRNRLIRFLGQRFSKITRSVVSNVLECAKADAELRCVEPPAWLGGEGRPVQDLLPATDSLIYLPGLFRNAPDYRKGATPQLFNLSALKVPFDPSAPEPKLWRETLNAWFDGDQEAIAALREWFGYVLTPDTRQQKILMMIGPPRSGKGTIARILGHLVGEKNMAGPSLASLGRNFGLAPLLGKSLAIINDARLSGRSDGAIVLERLLSISGEDTITVDRKHLPAVTCKLQARLMILSNELPRLTDSSGALASRMIVLPMCHSFLGQEDEMLTDKLLEELPGILRWALDGWRSLRERRRFLQPEVGRQMLDDLHGLASPITVFVRECCLLGPEYRATIDQLYAAWQAWCARNGRRETGTKQTFGRDLRAAFPALHSGRPREGSRRTTGYEGIGIPDG